MYDPSDVGLPLFSIHTTLVLPIMKICVSLITQFPHMYQHEQMTCNEDNSEWRFHNLIQPKMKTVPSPQEPYISKAMKDPFQWKP